MNFDSTIIKNKREDEDDDPAFILKIVELLKAKVKLDNGEEGYVFTKNTDEHPRGRFRCHVCNVPIGSTKSLEEHASGKNHSRRMQANFHSHENFSKIVIKESSKLSTDVGGKVVKAPGVDIPDLAPGEPVPPGFEDVVTRVPEIKATLDEMKAPLIGLEYLAEITPVGDEIEPKYCCLLCNKRGDPRTVLAHLVCFNHRIKYIGRYFPRTNTALALIPKVKEYKRGTGEVLAKIVKAIENKFGRLNPVIVDGAIFDQKKEEYYREMSNGRHFYETADSNYEMLVDIDFIKKCGPEGDGVLTIDIEKEEAKKKSTTLKNEMNKLKQKNTVSEQDKVEKKVFDRRPQQISNVKPKREKSVETISSSGSRSYSRSRSRSRSYSRLRSRSRSRSSSFSKSHSRSRLLYRHSRKDYEHGIRRRSRSPRYYYRSRSRSRSRSLSRTRYRSRSRSRGSSYKRFRSSTYRTKSPTYDRSSYRIIRYDSLYNGEGNSPSSERPKSIQVKVAELRDKRRKRDLYAEYVEKLEKDMAKTLKGYNKNPEMHPLYPEEWKKFWNRRYKELTAEGIDASKHDFKPEWIKFWLVRMKELHNEELEMKKEKYRIELGLNDEEKTSGIDSDVIEVSPTPLEDDKSNVTVDDIKNTWRALTGSEIKSAKEKTPEKVNNEKPFEAECDEPVRVITVLRLLTALESQLGSLGPRVNNLLSQAIHLEKKKPGSSDTLIEVSENSVLFETVKEKLKGQLFAGIVEKHMVSATRTAIQNVAELFNSWKSRKNAPEPVIVSSQVSTAASIAAASEPLIVPGIGAIDKVAIAQQIAAVLIAQGKTNVTEQELEQLINAVVGMAQATTRPTPVVSNVSVASYSAAAPQLSTVASVSVSSSGLETEQEYEDKPSVLQQLVSSVSKFTWGSTNSSSKVVTNFDDALSPSLRNRLLPKISGDLPEEDMKALLQNFRDLTEQEQQSVISYLKELEAKDQESVEKLRKFVVSATENKLDVKSKEDNSGRLSPFSMREGGANPSIEDGSKLPIANSKELDDDEDDYSYEEIYKAAEKKISGKSVVEQMIEEQQKKIKLSHPQASPFSDKSFSRDSTTTSSKVSDDPECVLNDAKVTIDNIMGQLPSKFTGAASRITTPKTNPMPPAPTPVSVPVSVPVPVPVPVEPPSAYSTPILYNNSSNPPQNKMPSNLLNDYNYQDDIFTYSNESFQNYPVESNYRVEPNPGDDYGMQQPPYTPYPNIEQNYNNYESWNDNYSQYPPPPQQQPMGYHPSQPPPPMMNPNFRPPGPYDGPPPNEYNGPPLYNAYREYY